MRRLQAVARHQPKSCLSPAQALEKAKARGADKPVSQVKRAHYFPAIVALVAQGYPQTRAVEAVAIDSPFGVLSMWFAWQERTRTRKPRYR